MMQCRAKHCLLLIYLQLTTSTVPQDFTLDVIAQLKEPANIPRSGSVRWQATLDRVAFLAFYFRLHRKFARHPSSENTIGYVYQFPHPIQFKNEAGDDFIFKCSSANYTACLESLVFNIRKNNPWTKSGKDVILHTPRLHKVLENNFYDGEVTISQILCWFSINEVWFMRQVPDCWIDSYDSGKEVKWNERLHFKERVMGVFDPEEDDFECATRSFCPDPCHGVFSNCSIQALYNSDFSSLRLNKWNISRPCATHQTYRPDTRQCVHLDECVYKTCPVNSFCQDSLPSARCICGLGYVQDENATDGRCRSQDLLQVKLEWISPFTSHSYPNYSIRSLVSFAMVHFMWLINI